MASRPLAITVDAPDRAARECADQPPLGGVAEPLDPADEARNLGGIRRGAAGLGAERGVDDGRHVLCELGDEALQRGVDGAAQGADVRRVRRAA